MVGTSDEPASSRHTVASNDEKDKPKKESKPMATVGETLDFAFQCGTTVKILFFLGFVGAILNGLVYPILAYLFSKSFTDIAAASDNGLGQVRELAYTFLIVGVYALICGTVQTLCFEVVANMATKQFRLEWFKALLRQDASYFDVNDIGGIAGQVGPSSNKYRRGMGRKFGEGIQFLTTGIGGIAYGFWASWRVALLVLAVVPFCAAAALSVVFINQSKGSRSAASYKTAAGVAYAAVSAIKTVLSLNGIQEMITKYKDATQEAYVVATGVLLKAGLANGNFLNSAIGPCPTVF